MKKIIISLFILGTLAGCSNMEKPVGIGSGRDDMKKSPCACLTFYDYQRGGWI